MKLKLESLGLMRAVLLATLFQSFGNFAAPAAPAPGEYTVVARGPNERIWERIDWQTNSASGVIRKVPHRYVELSTGISRLVGEKWVDAKPDIEVTPTGAQAVDAQHSVFFLENINTLGAIQFVTPDGIRLKSNVLGLSYWDSATGRSVFIAETRDSDGQLLPSNHEALYPDAFDGGFRADLLYVNSVSGFEQFVVLREQPPAPTAFAMDPATTFLQVVTEFLEPPVPQVVIVPGRTDSDEYLSFGVMQMGRGEAFAVGSETNHIPVTKHWVTLEGRRCLVEQIPFAAAREQLGSLPLPAPRSASSGAQSNLKHRQVANRISLPIQRVAKRLQPSLRLANSEPSRAGFAMDYSIVTVQTNRVFQGDVTYFVTNSITLAGSNVFEGGTVIKFATNSSLVIAPSSTTPTATFCSSAYHPIYLTSKDDNSAGETISGSTGSPVGYYASTALMFGGLSPIVPALGSTRIAYARQAISVSGMSLSISDGQFINCQEGVAAGGGTVTIRNALFSNVATNFVSSGSLVVDAENVTFSQCSYLGSGGSDSSVSLTNCILANVTNLTAGSLITSADYNAFYQTTSFGNHIAPSVSSPPFQVVGAGNFYLAPDCPYRNAGTWNVNSALMGGLAKKTTFPPIVYAYTYLPLNACNLSPQAQRDSDTPDLGWHYDPIDYALGWTAVTNPGVVTLTPGAVVATFGTNSGTYGLGLLSGGGISAQGTPTALARIVSFNTVQEQPASGWTEPTSGMVFDGFGGVPGSVANFRFTDFSSLAQRVYILNMGDVIANLQDCQLHSGSLASYPPTLNLTNCLLERVYSSLWQSDSAQPVIRDNSFFGGTFDFLPFSATNAIIQDNLFDSTVIPEDLTSSGYIGGHNASITNCDHMKPAYASDIVLANTPQYQVGPLGNFYRLSSSILFDADTNTTAAQVGLYHYTTITNLVSGYEIKETNSWLDVGYHYVAVDSNTNAIDSNGDGIPDYASDANGNGTVDSAEIGWNITGDLGLSVLITKPKNGSLIP